MRGAKETADLGGADLLVSFRENEPRLVRFIASRVGCRAVAQDLAQEVFLRAGTAGWRSVLDPRAFLFRIALNLISNHKTQTRRRAELDAEAKELLCAGIDELTPERRVIASEEMARVAEVLQDLPERTRNIVHWCRFDGLTKSEIASRLGITYQAVDGHLQRALHRLLQADQAAGSRDPNKI
ncbi:RNA polymerase sigma factor [Steroidobacter flavus]|uniref:RNA polymerase sigma factor n=1 Tax=Steroidobacter flavus TaxID=1842136 RepID=A0ABV8SVT9_9GAMM